MNDYISLGNADLNPNFEGLKDIRTQFGATKFRLDGASTDYIYDAMQVVCNGSVFTPFLNGMMRDIVFPYIRDYADHALLMKDETCMLPKVLIWDVDSGYTNARAIKWYAAHPDAGTLPGINGAYNKDGKAWNDKHEPQTFVIGSSLTFGSHPKSKYRVQDYFGNKIMEQPAMLVNAPMYFESGYYDTLWDWFFWIEDLTLNPALNQNFVAKIELCCDDLKETDGDGKKRLGVFNNASAIALGEKVKLPTTYYGDGTITEIEVSYDPGDAAGQYIQIKGFV